MSKLPHKHNDIPLLDPEDIDTTCEQYSQYFQLNALADHQMNHLSGDVETALMRIDEFGSLVDAIRADRDKMLQKIAPALVEKARELQRVYSLIDQLEEFMKQMNTYVRQLEDQINETTHAYSLVQRHRTINSFGLGSISSKYIPVIQQKTASTMPKYNGLDIVDSGEFFEKWRKEAYDENLYTLPKPPTE